MQVTEIHPGSIAEAAGLRPGLLYLTGEPGNLVTEWKQIAARRQSGVVTSRFVDLAGGTVTVLKTVGFPWGIKVEQPHTKMLEEVRNSIATPTEFAGRILYAPDFTYQDLTLAAYEGFARPSVLRRFVDVFWRLIGQGSKLTDLRQPVSMVAAAMAAQKGDFAMARRLRPPPTESLLHDMGSAVGALYLFCDAMIDRAAGVPVADVAERLKIAHEMAPKSQRIADALTAAGVPTMSARDVTRVRPFAIDYALPEADALTGPVTPAVIAQARGVSLSAALNTLQADQLAAVVLMNGYRVNGFYDPMMDNLACFYPIVGARLPFVHVVSSLERVSNPDIVALWRKGEDAARAAGVPVTVLYDHDDAVPSAQMATGFPTLYLLTRDRTILYEGNSDDDGPFWEAFERLDGMLALPPA
jgi:hypothetical protein